MSENTPRALSEVLDALESTVKGDSIAIRDVVETLGGKSFASLMLVFSLISTSPASAIPGITAIVACMIFILVVQMIFGRKSVWLPDFITRRHMSADKLCRGIGWLRRPVHFVERFLKARWTFLCHRPWLWVPLFLILGLTLVMPIMEIVPTSGSIASAAIALFAAGLLVRDGALIAVSLVPLLGVPAVIYQVAFGA